MFIVEEIIKKVPQERLINLSHSFLDFQLSLPSKKGGEGKSETQVKGTQRKILLVSFRDGFQVLSAQTTLQDKICINKLHH